MSDMAILRSDCPRASIVVTCKGRLHHLRRTLPCMLAQTCSFAYETIVVDFGCPQGAFDWCRGLDVRNLVALKVLDDTQTFHLSRARNCGASAAVRADPGLRRCRRFPGAELAGNGDSRLAIGPRRVVHGGQWPANRLGAVGDLRGSREVFHAIRGYDEALRGWNGEDGDLYARAGAQAATIRFPTYLLTPIHHGDAERVRYQPDKEIGRSNARNVAIVAARTGPVNPQGYGRGELMIHRGQGATTPPVTWNKRRRIVRPLRRVPARDLQPPTSNLQPPTSDLRSPTSDLRPPNQCPTS